MAAEEVEIGASAVATISKLNKWVNSHFNHVRTDDSDLVSERSKQRRYTVLRFDKKFLCVTKYIHIINVTK